MSTRERPVDRGTRRGRRLLSEFATELREARLAAGLRQSDLGRAAGVSRSQVSCIERAVAPGLGIVRASRLVSVLGRELAVRSFPVGPSLRDAGHVELLARLRPHVSSALRWRLEAPVGAAGDHRAFDVRLEGRGFSIAVEAETRLRDLQALVRELSLKQRDGGVDRLVLLVRDSRSNRVALRAARSILSDALPLRTPALLDALRAGRDPGANGIAIL